MSHWEPVLTDLVRQRGGALVRYAALLCGDRAEGEDLVQEALTKVFAVMRKPPRGDGRVAIEHAEAYVRRTVLTLYLDGYRRRRRWAAVRHLLPGSESTAGPERHSPDRLDVDRALAVLGPRQRACMVLRYYADLTVPQIADELGVSPGTVKRHLHDAGLHLVAELDGSLEGERR
ncbi:sigma-70 family RNA polymerase sigma factor [Occultella kanbiaonis]|uniref:sigma-70 family RNA polymerase sigma factor n=1 Tax=Occultella kanbiaonis TaxID=2675754 RepID=UPI0012B8549A|nr:sigma-70 family RNA polymerase sigma factor [Occultella kanbiaonis]